MRARQPDSRGFVENGGVRLGYEVFGETRPTLLLLPTWTIVHSRFWKMQVPYLARHFRVVTFDGPGNGLSDRPLDPRFYDMESVVADVIAVMDATATESAVLASLSQASSWSLKLAADHSEKVLGQVFIAPSLPLTPQAPERATIPETFLVEFDDPQGWEKYNAHYWRTNYRDFVEFFFAKCLHEPHSTKPQEDAVGWGLETTPEVLLVESRAKFGLIDKVLLQELCQRITSPTLVIHGVEDGISPYSRAEALAEATGGTLVGIEGGGHFPMTRDPVMVNRLVKDFVERVAA